MQNLINAIVESHNKELADFAEGLGVVSTIKDVLGHWYYTEVMTNHMQKKEWTCVDDLKAYVLKRKTTQLEKRRDVKLNELDILEVLDGDVASLALTIDWRKSRMWGMNPQATLQGNLKDGTYVKYVSDIISGCGYCKLSTALAEVLNQCKPLIRDMAIIKDANINTPSRELLGYGSGYGVIPSFEGGVGESSLRCILEKLGLELENSAHKDNSDFYYYKAA